METGESAVEMKKEDGRLSSWLVPNQAISFFAVNGSFTKEVRYSEVGRAAG